ncbi:MAG: hypothetical protein AB4372_10185 [Xenococcus sp. (in: cyanobacteria)]
MVNKRTKLKETPFSKAKNLDDFGWNHLEEYLEYCQGFICKNQKFFSQKKHAFEKHQIKHVTGFKHKQLSSVSGNFFFENLLMLNQCDPSWLSYPAIARDDLKYNLSLPIWEQRPAIENRLIPSFLNSRRFQKEKIPREKIHFTLQHLIKEENQQMQLLIASRHKGKWYN